MNRQAIIKIVRAALKEDKVHQDITSKHLISPRSQCHAQIVARQDGTLAGIPFARAAFKEFDEGITITFKKRDGDPIKKGQVIAKIKGKTRSVLTCERTALNFIGYLSGIATRAGHYVAAIKPAKAEILDTRKTTPTLRPLEKYAVKCGGGVNHRADLSELVLIKDNHRAMYKKFTTLAQAIRDFRHLTRKKIEIEVDTLIELKDAIEGNPDYVLLDNMRINQLRKAVALVKKLPGNRRPLLEASGGITLKNIKKIAATGVDRISIGALTHSHPNFDASLEITRNV